MGIMITEQSIELVSPDNVEIIKRSEKITVINNDNNPKQMSRS